jgi:trk system potassium uptake protein
MMGRILELPLLVILMGITAVSMYLPAAHAVVLSQHSVARSFFYSGSILLILTAMIGLASATWQSRNLARGNLIALVAAYAVLPILMALPVAQAVRDTTFANAWFEMVSSFTTTGATLYDPARLPASVHLWRAQVGWMGGFFIMVAAVAVLAPVNLGGVEVLSGRVPGRGSAELSQITRIADPSRRVMRHALILFPAYGGLTLMLWVLLLIAGESGLVALCHAMSTVSTSSISPVGGMAGAQTGVPGEMAIFVVLLASLSRKLWPGAGMLQSSHSIERDPELRLGLVVVASVTIILFLRHWLSAAEMQEAADIQAGTSAFWGILFTAVSFLTTTGFTSQEWAVSQSWSGLGTPGLVLAGLAILGGGIATTAGGVKLLRVYALFRHGEREMQRLVHPSSIGGSGQLARRLRREGAYVAWIFFILFALSIAAVMAALTIVGMTFEAALVMTLAALTTTGPLALVAGDVPLSFADLGLPAKAILGLAMVVGRVEVLAILALMAPESWRR